VTTGTILVGGHEGGGGVAPGRRLHLAVEAALHEHAVAVAVPMTFGRNPAMVADAARTLQPLSTSRPGRIALAAPFGTADHLVALLRGAARDAGDAGLIVAARASNPFDDAELHRIAHLVRAHGSGIEVEVALLRDDGDVLIAHERLRRLGVARSVVVPAGFGPGPTVPCTAGLSAHGPLLGAAAIARVVAARVDEACHLLADHHDDGLAAGVAADHHHGYAHSHSHSHDHPHDNQHEEPAWPRGSRTTSSAVVTSNSTPAG